MDGLRRLAALPEADKQACIDAYRFLQRMQDGEETETKDLSLFRVADGLILRARRVIRALEAIGLMPHWVEEALGLLQTGGQAWTDAEKAKVADLNWRIVAEKPIHHGGDDG